MNTNYKMMKRFFLLIIFTSLIPGINAKDTDTTKTDKSVWAINLSYPSYFGIFLENGFSRDYVYYPAGISFSADWKKKSDRTRLSLGLIYRAKNIRHNYGISEKLSLLEIPIKVKCCLIKNEPKVDPFLSTGLSLC
jgi:hypothetical protein